MTWLTDLWSNINDWRTAIFVALHFAIFWSTIVWILMTKAESQSAVAWCLIVILVPYLGALFFVLFGYQHVHRPLRRKRQHRQRYRLTVDRGPWTVDREPSDLGLRSTVHGPRSTVHMHHLADRVGAFPLTQGNKIDIYHHSPNAFEAMLQAMRSARHHIHLEFFIVQPDELGRQVLDILTERAVPACKCGCSTMPWARIGCHAGCSNRCKKQEAERAYSCPSVRSDAESRSTCAITARFWSSTAWKDSRAA